MNRSEPPYLRIVAELRRRIAAGELRAGDRVPSTRQIAQEWGVAIATATKVLAALSQEGLVSAVPGVGTVVNDLEPAPARPTRRREPRAPTAELTRERIVRTAIDIADTEGPDALSMRRIAAELDAAPMSLYRYVGSKAELDLLMMDAAFTEHPFPEVVPAGWREQLELAMRLQWRLYRRHPWLAQVISLTRPQVLPNLMPHAEWVLRALDGLGLDHSTMLWLHLTLFGYVRGTAVNLEWETDAEQTSGMSADQWMERQDPALNEIVSSGAFPTFSKVTMSGGFDLDLDQLFEFGMRRLLDGVAELITRGDQDQP